MIKDTMTYIGAQKLASQIEEYWRKKGKAVKCEIVRDGTDRGGGDSHGKSIYSVRSNLTAKLEPKA